MICIYSVYTAKFGPWELGPQHGFARISQWKVAEEPKVCSKIEKSHQLTCMAAWVEEQFTSPYDAHVGLTISPKLQTYSCILLITQTLANSNLMLIWTKIDFPWISLIHLSTVILPLVNQTSH